LLTEEVKRRVLVQCAGQTFGEYALILLLISVTALTVLVDQL
jgi:hypothetical protein